MQTRHILTMWQLSSTWFGNRFPTSARSLSIGTRIKHRTLYVSIGYIEISNWPPACLDTVETLRTEKPIIRNCLVM